MSGVTASKTAVTGITQHLAAFVAGSRFEDIPEQVRGHGARAIFNGFGTALGGSSDQAIENLGKVLATYSSAPAASVFGKNRRLDAPTAAFLNAAAMNVFDFDDTHTGTIIHPTAPIAPVVFAMAEMRALSGEDVLHAFILGVEVACRLGNAISPWHYDRGWHITATCGVFGAAAAAAKLLDLSQQQIVWALGNAAAQSSGLVETLGFMAKSVGVGGAARNGLLSAQMAQAGVEGPLAPIEGPRGFLQVTCDDPQYERVIDGLGTQWEILRNMFKPYPCGVVLNPVIDACFAARARSRFAPEQVARITLRGNPLLKARADRPNVATGREAQVSVQHAIAVTLLRGSAGVADFSDQAVTDPSILSLRGKVVGVQTDAAIPVEAVRMQIDLTDGSTIDEHIDIATGSIDRPMTDAALKEKFVTLVRYGCPELDAGPLMDKLWRLSDLPDAAAVAALTRPF